MVKGQPMDKRARLQLVADAVRKLEAADAVQAPTMDAQERRVDRVLASHGKLAYSVAEAAKAMSVSQWYIRDEIARGNLNAMNSRGRKIIPGWELLRYLEENMSTATAPAEGGPDDGQQVAHPEVLQLNRTQKNMK